MNGDSMTPDQVRLPAPRNGLSPARRESAIVRRGYLEVRAAFVDQETLDSLLLKIQKPWRDDDFNVGDIIRVAKRIAIIGHGFDVRNETVQRIVIGLCRISRVFFETDAWQGYFPTAIGRRLHYCQMLAHVPTPRAEDHEVLLRALSTIMGSIEHSSDPVIWILRAGTDQARHLATRVLTWYPLEQVGPALRETQASTPDPILAATCAVSLLYLTSNSSEETICREVDWYSSEAEPTVRSWIADNLLAAYGFCNEYSLHLLAQLAKYESNHCDDFATRVARESFPSPDFHELSLEQVESLHGAVRALHNRGQPGLEYLIDSLPTELERRRTSS